MKVSESFLEKAWGGSVDNPKIEDIKVAILETKNMDEEHGAFWVGIFNDKEEEIVLEVHKNLKTILIIDSASVEEKSITAESWEKVIENYDNLLKGDIGKIIDWINKK